MKMSRLLKCDNLRSGATIWILTALFQVASGLNCPANEFPGWDYTLNKRLDVSDPDVMTETLPAVTDEQSCRLSCLRHEPFDCLSFSYSLVLQTCHMFSVLQGAGQLVDDSRYTYVEGQCKLTPEVSENCTATTARADIAFVIDGSGSICDDYPEVTSPTGEKSCDNWETVRSFLDAVADRLEIGPDGSRMAVVFFANDGVLKWDLDRHKNRTSLKQAIRELSYPGGNTNTYEGLNMMRTQVFGMQGDRPDIRNLAVVLTDGKPTKNVDETAPEAKRAQDEGVNTFAVGVTDDVDEETLKTLSSYPKQRGQNYFATPNFAGLLDVFEKLLAAACLPPVLTTLSRSTTTHSTAEPEPETTKLPSSGVFAIDDVYIVLMGMGGVILLLIIIIIVTLCQYGSANK